MYLQGDASIHIATQNIKLSLFSQPTHQLNFEILKLSTT